MVRYQLKLLGGFVLLADDELVVVRAAHERVLSILALTAHIPVDRDRIVTELWGDDPPVSARNTLQVHVSAIRKLAPGIIDTTPSGYALAASVATDVTSFQQLAVEALRIDGATDWNMVVKSCSAAIDLWRGTPFDAIPDSGDAAPVRVRLTEQYLEILERRAEAMLSLGRDEEVVAELEGLVRLHPLRERFWEHLMLGRYRLGRQADALRAFREVSTILGEELGIEPGERLRSLEESILMQLPPARTGGAAIPHNLPVATSTFIGREDVSLRIAQSIATYSTVSITGGPGVGKSRLATEVAWRVVSGFPAGAYVVRLAGASSSFDVAAEIVATVGGSEVTSDLELIAQGLSQRPMLLILDNCEHVLAPVNVFCTAAAQASGPLRVVTTTRRVIGLADEHVVTLPPLPVPAERDIDPDSVLMSPAVRLLIDRSRTHTSDFRTTDLDPTIIASIVRQTAGVPLALEMAARWIASVGIHEFENLRHLVEDPTIDGAIELSVRLMAPEDRAFFYAASVFSGQATLRTLATVCAPLDPLIEATGSATRLVESSLLHNEIGPSGRMTYSMLQPIREFAQRRLELSGRADAVVRRMVDRYASVAPTFDVESASAIDAAMPDLRKSLRWLLDADDIERAEVIANALVPYWVARYLTWEAEAWFTEILERSKPDPRFETLWAAAWVAFNGNDYTTATARYERLRELAVAAEDQLYEGRALYGIARMQLPVDRPLGLQTLTSALDVFRGTKSKADIGECLMGLGFGYAWMGESEAAEPFLVEGYEIGVEIGDHRLIAQCRRFASLAAYFDDRKDASVRLAAEARAAAAEAVDSRVLGGALIQSALVETRWGDLATAATYAADALRPLPDAASIDIALVFIGCIPVLVEAGEAQLAADAFGHIDMIAASRNWQAIHDVNPSVAHFRARVPSIEVPTDDLGTTRAAIQRTLESIASNPATR
ncbi:MAG: winged helix-turn-helix domain-containing protein [Acidimicrobiia bacterium]|nr:winged helix-turn-helix domain-containing protein [Acidimicrobiia bacterium]